MMKLVTTMNAIETVRLAQLRRLGDLIVEFFIKQLESNFRHEYPKRGVEATGVYPSSWKVMWSHYNNDNAVSEDGEKINFLTMFHDAAFSDEDYAYIDEGLSRLGERVWSCHENFSLKYGDDRQRTFQMAILSHDRQTLYIFETLKHRIYNAAESLLFNIVHQEGGLNPLENSEMAEFHGSITPEHAKLINDLIHPKKSKERRWNLVSEFKWLQTTLTWLVSDDEMFHEICHTGNVLDINEVERTTERWQARDYFTTQVERLMQYVSGSDIDNFIQHRAKLYKEEK